MPSGMLRERPPKRGGCTGPRLRLISLRRNFDFFRNYLVAPRMGLGDHLVTIRVLEHPWTHILAPQPM